MTKNSILIPDGESTLTIHVVQCLSIYKNIEIHVLSKDPNAIIKHSRHIKSFNHYDFNLIKGEAENVVTDNKVLDELSQYHYYDRTKSEEIISEIIKYVRVTGSQIVFPIDEHIVKVLSANKEKFKGVAKLAPLPTHDIFITAIDKWKLSVFLSEQKLPHPTTVKYEEESGEKIIGQLQFPVIIKPIDLGNAQGIHSFHNSTDLSTFLKKQGLKHEYIIQPLIEGFDIDCSVLCSDGKIIAHTIQKGIEWSENTYQAAVGIEFLHDQEVYSVVEQMMKCLNWSGVAHIDLRYDSQEKKVNIIEINARYWGSLLGSLNVGVNFPVMACLVVNGNLEEGKKEYKFKRYFMGKSPFKRLIGGVFSTRKDKIRLRDTSLYYSLKDPKPFLIGIYRKVRR